MLSKFDILQSNDLPREKVDVPEWGGSLYVKTMTGAEKDEWESSLASGKKVNLANFRARLAVAVCCDERGEPLFDSGDVDALSKKSSKALQRIFNVASRLNAISGSDVEELAKN